MTPPTEAQHQTDDFHYEHREARRNNILDAVIEEWEDLVDFEGGNRDQFPDTITTREEAAKFVGVNYLKVKCYQGDSGEFLVGYSLDIRWI